MNEGAVDDRVKKYIRENCASEFRQYLDTPVGDLPDEFRKHLDQIDGNLYKSCVEHGVRLVDYFRIYLMKTFDINRGKGPVEYLRGIARIACEDLDFFGYNANQSDIALFKQLVLFVYNNPDDISIKYDSNLNGLSFDEFKKQVNDIRKAFNIRMRSKTGNVKGDRKYKVVAINSGSEAEKYGRYTTWCITHGSYSSYAKNGSRFYFCLEDGFENVKKEVGPGCPLDRYGLSMVSVLIDIDGEPTIITTRWNHEHDGENNENFHTVEQFEKVMGIPFYETFKPYTRDELRKMGVVSFDEARERLEAGEDPEDIFNDVSDMSDGWSLVELNGKYNFIDDKGNFLSDVWFDYANDFHEGVAVIRINERGYNFIDKEVNFLFNFWFIYVGNFHEGFARVKNKKDEWNFIDKEGKLLSDVCFDFVDDFHEGFARVKNKKDEWNFIDKEGKLLSDVCFDFVDDFHEGFARVTNRDAYWNFINREGKLLFDTWFAIDADDFKDGFGYVQNGKDEWNIIDTKGNFLSDVWFDDIFDFECGFACVKNKKGEWNFIDKEGKLLSDIWFNSVDVFENGFARVETKDHGIKYLDTKGKLHDRPVKESLSESFFGGGMIGGGFDNTLSPASYNVQGPDPGYTYQMLAFNDTLQQKPNRPDYQYYIHPGSLVRGVGCNNPDKHYTGVVQSIIKDYSGNVICLRILSRKTSKIVSIKADDNLELLIPKTSMQTGNYLSAAQHNISITNKQ